MSSAVRRADPACADALVSCDARFALGGGDEGNEHPATDGQDSLSASPVRRARRLPRPPRCHGRAGADPGGRTGVGERRPGRPRGRPRAVGRVRHPGCRSNASRRMAACARREAGRHLRTCRRGYRRGRSGRADAARQPEDLRVDGTESGRPAWPLHLRRDRATGRRAGSPAVQAADCGRNRSLHHRKAPRPQGWLILLGGDDVLERSRWVGKFPLCGARPA